MRDDWERVRCIRALKVYCPGDMPVRMPAELQVNSNEEQEFLEDVTFVYRPTLRPHGCRNLGRL